MHFWPPSKLSTPQMCNPSILGEWARRDAGDVKGWIANNAEPNSVANRFK